jgi:glycosyltransferase involved in cell wall biosynthesis
MRIAIDFKVMGTEAASRGMGRFTQQQVFEALRADPSLEVFLLLQKPLDPATCLYDWQRMERAHPVWLDPVLGAEAPDARNSHERLMLYSHRLQAKLQALGADVFHDATPFLPPYYTALTRTPVVATCYDLIPLIFPLDYFPGPAERDSYLRMLRNLRTATRVAAISRSAAADLHLYTGYQRTRIDITYPQVDEVFRLRAVDDNARKAARAAARRAQPELPERFFLSVTGIHRSKNLGFLLDAFARARAARGWVGLPLVVLLPARWTRNIFHEKFGSPPDVVLLSEVSDETLRDLYVAAEFVFQPSLYEGFGYPVAEAMHCGAAVIATRTASIPEITGDAALLLDPTDAEAGAAAIRRLATEPAARGAMRKAALERAPMFGRPERLGEATVACWRAAAGPAAPRPRIALWSSMPPLHCGIADYTAELADAMSATHEVDVYTDGSYQPSARAAPNIYFRHVRDFDPAEPGLVDSIFQLQARDYQYFMYRQILRHGGTVMLHDIALAIAFFGLARHFGDYAEFEDGMLAAEGPEAVRDLGGVLARSGGAPDAAALRAVFDRHRVLRWAIGPHNRVLTHTDALAQDALRHYPDARVRVVRQGYADRAPIARHLPLATWRQRLGVGGSGLVVGVFGIVGRNKRIESIIAGFEPLWQAHPDSLLVIVGACYEQAYRQELRDRIAASPARDRIHFGDYASPDAFHALVALSDVLVALRWPALGGLSAVLLRGLAAGKPVIVSDIPDWRGAGNAASLHVPTPGGEAEGIAAHLLRLAADPAERVRLGQVAREWYHREATLQAMAADHATGGRPPATTPDRDP